MTRHGFTRADYDRRRARQWMAFIAIAKELGKGQPCLGTASIRGWPRTNRQWRCS